MNFSEKMTGMMNAVRSVTGDTNKLSVGQATSSLDAASIFVDHGVVSPSRQVYSRLGVKADNDIKWNNWVKLVGVIKRLLYSLVPHKIGGACYAA